MNARFTSFSRRGFLKSAAATAFSIGLGNSASLTFAEQSNLIKTIVTDAGGRRYTPGATLAWEGATTNAQIVIDPTDVAQTIEGFGSAFTDAACYVLNQLPDSARHDLLTELFSPEQMGLRVCRLCIGASDYVTDLFSYDEGTPDPTMSRFSIEHDLRYVIPVLREAVAINPSLYLFGSPWSPPGWMKYGGSMLGGSIQPKNCDAYAHYVLKYLQAYEAAGVHVSAITIQNEIDADQNGRMPACIWSAEVEDRYISDNLGPLLRKHSPSTKIWVLDHNYDLVGRVLDELAKPEVKQYVNAVAWHYYAGEPEQMKRIPEAFPGMEMRWTEGGPHVGAPEYLTEWAHWSALFSRVLRNGPCSITTWNLALDENGKPNIGPAHCAGLVTIHSGTGEIIRGGLYCAMMHFSRGLRPGCKIVSSRGDVPGISHVAARSTDGSIVVILTNSGAARSVRVACGNRSVEVAMPADSVVTLTA